MWLLQKLSRICFARLGTRFFAGISYDGEDYQWVCEAQLLEIMIALPSSSICSRSRADSFCKCMSALASRRHRRLNERF